MISCVPIPLYIVAILIPGYKHFKVQWGCKMLGKHNIKFQARYLVLIGLFASQNAVLLT